MATIYKLKRLKMKKSTILNGLLDAISNYNNIKFIVSISGGKDSKATLISTIDTFIKRKIDLDLIEVIYCDTKFGAQNTIDELKAIEQKLNNDYNIKLTTLINDKYPNGMNDLILSKNMFPNRLNKFCTVELKMIPATKYFEKLYADGYKIINLVGKRRDESNDRANIRDNEYYSNKRLKMDIWHPIADWSETDVYDLLHSTWGIPREYYLGEKRVGCDTCFQSNLGSIARMSIDKIKEINLLEDIVSKKRGEQASYFYRKNNTFNGVAKVSNMVNYAKNYSKKTTLTYHQRLLVFISNKIGQKVLRYKFLHYGYIPTKSQISKWCNCLVMPPQKYLINIEDIGRDLLSSKELLEVFKEKEKKDSRELNCDCESYNLL